MDAFPKRSVTRAHVTPTRGAGGAKLCGTKNRGCQGGGGSGPGVRRSGGVIRERSSDGRALVSAEGCAGAAKAMATMESLANPAGRGGWLAESSSATVRESGATFASCCPLGDAAEACVPPGAGAGVPWPCERTLVGCDPRPCKAARLSAAMNTECGPAASEHSTGIRRRPNTSRQRSQVGRRFGSVACEVRIFGPQVAFIDTRSIVQSNGKV